MFKVLGFILLCIAFSSCNVDRVSEQCDDDIRYDEVSIIYTTTDYPWAWEKFCPIEPAVFTKAYKGCLKIMILKDTLFIKQLAESINLRKYKGVFSADSCGCFDAYFLLKLKRKESVDTHAVSDYWLWFNREVYLDSATATLIVEKIIRYDKEFVDIVSDYYDKGTWYPFLGKSFSKSLPLSDAME